MHLVKALIVVSRASRPALAAPSKPTSDAGIENIQARELLDDAQAEEYSAADYEAMVDDLVALMVGKGKSKEKYCKECHKICIAVSPVAPAVAACGLCEQGMLSKHYDPDFKPGNQGP